MSPILLDRIEQLPAEPIRCFLGGRELVSRMHVEIRSTGRTFCLNCGTGTRKNYGGGYCWRCFSTLARTDSCIVRPHTCHFHLGTCREPDWGMRHCMVPHVVYLALTSHLKVGVTREDRKFERWAEQGASEAVVIARTPDRKTAGFVEHELSRHFSDRTNWARLVTGRKTEVDWEGAKEILPALLPEELRRWLVESSQTYLSHPVERYPPRARSIRLTKSPVVRGRLLGVVGQYLLFEDGAFNVRAHGGHEVELHVE
ncbi:MAG: DUF2797 domain-containing protein [Deltaproteobacteria bacterium]|nr:MAG: DUF2797 domain-containing protein [Deltaproteobacteria bacterium]